jgi:hypothetical protein
LQPTIADVDPSSIEVTKGLNFSFPTKALKVFQMSFAGASIIPEQDTVTTVMVSNSCYPYLSLMFALSNLLKLHNISNGNLDYNRIVICIKECKNLINF